ncbi:cytochrome c oxidase assembly protein [Enterovirga aerilata]|uniref:Cytochrome c oxidase assembly protein n=1 Tax=Enterovirga aerilata TaxID=2730920 RepID=A0A849I6T2_9HYPH|nr:cytochrome c oxidase assembly protein [Enterovirga sp. DB1703]NNM75192.1 cytochrome c oxidase assembly protein [Enterovirga sp. DB1703]
MSASDKRNRGAVPALAAALLAASAATAAAHGFAPIPPGDAWAFWSLDPLVLVPLLAAHWLYGRGLSVWRRRHGGLPAALPGWRVVSFLMGEFLLFVALVSPVDAVSETILSAHMVQHVLLVAAAPPLLVLGRPHLAWAAGLPSGLRAPLLQSRPARRLYAALDLLSRPAPATLLHGAALWIWHTPTAFELGRADDWMHAFEHACFFGTALLFWRALIAAAATPRAAIGGMAAALATLVHGGFLSALIGLSPEPIYPDSTFWAPLWGMTPLEDQQLAGAIMWVPAGAAYLAAGLLLAGRLVSGEPDLAPARRTVP